MGEAHVLADHQPLYLMEHRRVGLIGIAPVDATGRDDPQRRLARLHGSNLHRGGVGAKQASVGEIERVLHGARRVVPRILSASKLW